MYRYVFLQGLANVGRWRSQVSVTMDEVQQSGLVHSKCPDAVF